MNNEWYTEDKEVSKAYRAGYLKSVSDYLARAREDALSRRGKFISPELVLADREGFRAKFREMLGIPLSDIDNIRHEPVKLVSDEHVADYDKWEIRRLRLDVFDGFTMYGVLFLPDDLKDGSSSVGKHPFVISQHGGLGTPESCSDFFGNNNYNHLTRRLLERGAVVFAPQLLLWDKAAFGDEYDRGKLDSDLKQIGGSITALEVFGISRCLDYFTAQSYCDPDHIGMAGLSYGGFYTLMTTASDTRIRSAYASCSFTDKLVHGWTDWTWKNSAATFLDAEIAGLVAPRAIVFDAGDHDHLFGSDGAKHEFARAKEYFDAAGVPDSIKLICFDGDHELCPQDDGMEFLFAHL